jgi:hypothetical protein
MKWLDRLMHKQPDTLLERADLFADAMEKGDIVVKIQVKNPRALAELRRLAGHARR